MTNDRKPIKSFRDLEVYQLSYESALNIAKQVLPQIPADEKYDLKDQLSRSTKAIPTLIAEGYAKKHQKAGFRKYIDDAMAEANETIVGLEFCKDLYHLDPKIIEPLIDNYDKVARQLYNLGNAWSKFKENDG